jgi:tRNA dimethylallyltransferase
VAADAPAALLVVVLGPTGTGKTALSLTLAREFAGEIVNCDSVAMYREFEIGTAKPSSEYRQQVPHHLFDGVGQTECMTAGEYARQARRVLAEIGERGRLPIVTGGTGLYLRALVEGLFPGPTRSEELRERLRSRAGQKGSPYLHRVLIKLDPAAASRIHSNDSPKVIRAIEVCLASRQEMTKLWAHGRDALQGFRVLRLGLSPERQALYDRINQRARKMFDEGLVEETQLLWQRYGSRSGTLNSLGYKQALEYLQGKINREQAITATQQAHRNYAKRQVTWFRREPDVTWLEGFGDDIEIQRKAACLVRQYRNPALA